MNGEDDGLEKDLEAGIQAPTPTQERLPADIGKEEQQLGTPTDSDAEADNAVDFEGWESLDDAGNPRNWSFGKKSFHTAIPALYGFVVYVTLSLITTQSARKDFPWLETPGEATHLAVKS